jgi:hypothetical protein
MDPVAPSGGTGIAGQNPCPPRWFYSEVERLMVGGEPGSDKPLGSPRTYTFEPTYFSILTFHGSMIVTSGPFS